MSTPAQEYYQQNAEAMKPVGASMPCLASMRHWRRLPPEGNYKTQGVIHVSC
jgi:hypothetical protein